MTDQFKFEGVLYTAVDAKPFYGCINCSFYIKPCTRLIKEGGIPPCQDWKRPDNRDVIFVEVQ